MSHFYGSLGDPESSPIPGGRVSSESGLEVVLRSPEGCVVIQVSEGEAADGGLEDRVRIVFKGVMSWPPEVPPQFVGHAFEVYNGPLSECLFEGIRTNTQESEK